MKRVPNALLWSVCAALCVPLIARAETSGVAATGFTVTVERGVDVPADRLWTAMTQLPAWWNSLHTWSGKASNMSVDLRAGGCWCETWEGGAVLHGTVAHIAAGKVVRFFANLGPLQDRATTGVLTLGAKVVDGKTVLKLVYKVAGPPDAGLVELAPAVDQVLTEQMTRLAAYAERGKPD